MIAANHERPVKSAWHELLATISARDTVDHGSRSLHIVTSRNCRRGLPAQSNLLLLIWFLFVVVSASAQTAPTAAGKSVQSSTAPTANAPSPEVSKYVGAETCKSCHEEIYNAWAKTPHWKTTLNTKGGPSKQGCEGCHGPGADHVAGGGDKTKIFVFEGKSRQETSARCLTCHGEAHEQSHFAQSAHSGSDVGCLDCHSPHHPKEKEFLLVQEQPHCVTDATPRPRQTLPNLITTASTRAWCNVWTATIRMVQQPCGSY